MIMTNKDDSIWQELKNFINKQDDGYIFTRKEIMEYFSNYSYLTPSIDVYRAYITRLGCLQSVGRGKYKKNLSIPSKLSLNKMMKIFKDENGIINFQRKYKIKKVFNEK